MKVTAITAALCLGGLSGCASIVSGVNQPLSVETRLNGEAVAGAACRLSSNKGTWFVTTPGSLTVHRGFQDLVVECTKNGLPPSIDSIPSHVRPIAFGNIVFGGIIGVVVDSGDGAAFDYPDLITIDIGRGAGAVPTTAPDSPAQPAPAGGQAPVSTPAPSPHATVNVQNPVYAVTNLPTPAPLKEMRYQISAERLAREEACSAKPVATLATEGPGSETYTVPCTSGESLTLRCDFGNCRVLR